MAKKRKMTKAQAAAARKETTREDELRAMSREHGREIRAMQGQVQKKANAMPVWQVVVIGIAALAIVALAVVVTAVPGILVAGR